MATKRDWAGDAERAVKAMQKNDWAILREWLPEGTMLKVVHVRDDQQIIVRWHLDSQPGMTHEAVLRFGSCFKERTKP